MSEIVIATPSTASLQEQLDSLAIAADGFVVDSQETYLEAANRLKAVKQFYEFAKKLLDPPVKIANQARKDMVANRDGFLRPTERIRDSYDHKMTKWTTDEERKRLEAEAEQRAIATAVAEEARLAEAVRMEEAGDQEGADRAMAAPIVAAPVYIPKSVPEVKGLTKPRVTWKGRVIDAALVPAPFLMPDEKKINQHAKTHKGEVPIPGVEFYSETSRIGVRG